MCKSLQVLRELLHTNMLREGRNITAVSYMNIYAYTSKIIEMPQTENPYIYLIVSGSMRLHTPSGIMDYVAGQYSVSAIDTPISGQILTLSEQNDFLALSIEFTLDDVISVILDIDGDLSEKMFSTEPADDIMMLSDERVFDTVTRLVYLINESNSLSFMSKHLKREIIFNVLNGSCGKHFLQSIINIQQADEIYKSNNWIKENYKTSFSVEQLAEQRNMSVSNFHQKFKDAVGMGPLQCQKRLRLTEARRLMLDKNMSVTETAMDIGYESVSQFIRDYKKMFGAAPKEDIQKLKNQLKINDTL